MLQHLPSVFVCVLLAPLSCDHLPPAPHTHAPTTHTEDKRNKKKKKTTDGAAAGGDAAAGQQGELFVGLYRDSNATQ